MYNHVLVQPAAFKQLDGTSVLNISTGTIAGTQKFGARKCGALTLGSEYKPLLVKVYKVFFPSYFSVSN